MSEVKTEVIKLRNKVGRTTIGEYGVCIVRNSGDAYNIDKTWIEARTEDGRLITPHCISLPTDKHDLLRVICAILRSTVGPLSAQAVLATLYEEGNDDNR